MNAVKYLIGMLFLATVEAFGTRRIRGIPNYASEPNHTRTVRHTFKQFLENADITPERIPFNNGMGRAFKHFTKRQMRDQPLLKRINLGFDLNEEAFHHDRFRNFISHGY